MSGQDTATAYPVLPLKNTVLFPHLWMPLAVGRARSLAAVEAALASEDKTLVVVPQKDPAPEEPARGDLFEVGTLGVIRRMERHQEGVQVIVQGLQRAELLATVQEAPFLSVRVALLPEPVDRSPEVEALHREILELANRISQFVDSPAQIALTQLTEQVRDPLQQVYLLASLLSLDSDKERKLLSASTRQEAMRLMHEYLAHELQIAELRHKIANQTKSGMERQQRDYLLRQQLRAIQEELGEQSPETAEAAELRNRFDEAELPAAVRKEAEKELKRLERISSNAADYQVIRNYLELILELPWNKTTEDSLDLGRAWEILDEDHFDLQEIKERIVEYLAVMKLNPQAKAPILCFSGPPGVGKTSLGQSIARALGRKFERMSLGGLHDEAELRGHRRTYIGAMPGRIIQAIRRAGVRNPLLMLDEVDKLGRDFRGDPAAALLEILDPAQNFEFRDNYLDLPFDLSKVFFITTANTLDTIPRPLLDRMEVLTLSGYSDEEKIQIARRYLIPRQTKEAGLTPEQWSIPTETLAFLIRRYTREAGVRELERLLGRIARKVATQIIEGKGESGNITPDRLGEMLGSERFFAEIARQQLPPGVATGLAWTEGGGAVLYIEAVLLPEGGDLTLTGQLGAVMQESARAAKSYIWSQADRLGIDRERIRKSGVHIHVPAGAIPKDGPSAGVTMATALASLYADCAVRGDTAMTGEITLSGLVFPVGGIKEKVLAAHRAGIRRVILPKENAGELRKLPDHVRQEIEFVPAERIEDVLTAAIPPLAESLHRAPVGHTEPVS
ncbi:MAG: endopeptidase La [Candidatus Competibacteraceae bacterium]